MLTILSDWSNTCNTGHYIFWPLTVPDAKLLHKTCKFPMNYRQSRDDEQNYDNDHYKGYMNGHQLLCEISPKPGIKILNESNTTCSSVEFGDH